MRVVVQDLARPDRLCRVHVDGLFLGVARFRMRVCLTIDRTLVDLDGFYFFWSKRDHLHFRRGHAVWTFTVDPRRPTLLPAWISP